MEEGGRWAVMGVGGSFRVAERVIMRRRRRRNKRRRRSKRTRRRASSKISTNSKIKTLLNR